MSTDLAGLRPGLTATTRSLAWAQWGALGISTWDPQSVGSLIDLEALIVFTGQRWKDDPRLAAQAIDWIAKNMSLVSLHQVKGVLRRLAEGAMRLLQDADPTAPPSRPDGAPATCRGRRRRCGPPP